MSSSSARGSRETRRRANRGARPAVANNCRSWSARSSPLPVESREPTATRGKRRSRPRAASSWTPRRSR